MATTRSLTSTTHGLVPVFGQEREPFAAAGAKIQDRAGEAAHAGLLQQRKIHREAPTDVLDGPAEMLFERRFGGVDAVFRHLWFTVTVSPGTG